MRKTLAVCVVVALISLGCASISKETMGKVTGGVLTGFLLKDVGKGRGNTAMVVAGAIVGTIVGGEIGKQMDENDRHRLAQATSVGMGGPVGTPHTETWKGQSGTYYQSQITPTAEFNRNNRECRNFTTEVVAKMTNGKSEVVQKALSACKDMNGVWQEVQS